MAAKLISMRGMHDDEIEEIRALLDQYHISFYETPAGNWGISMPAFWLHEDDDLKRAKELLDEYQQERGGRVRTEYDDLKREGQHPTMWRQFKAYPVHFIAFVILIALVAYVSVMPFIDIGM